MMMMIIKLPFRFIPKATPKETQIKYIQSDLLKIRSDVEAARTLLTKLPIPILPMNDVFQILAGNGLSFTDTDFEPCDVTH